MNWRTLFVLAVLSLSLSLALAVVGGGVTYRQAWSAAENKAQDLARLVEEHVRRTLVEGEAMLKAASLHVADPMAADFTPGSPLFALLTSLASDVTEVAHLYVVDERGGIRFMSGRGVPPPVNLSDRSYFQHHAADNGRASYVSPAFVSPTTGRLGFTLSRRLSRSDGSFAGTVVATYFSDVFLRPYPTLDVGPKSVFVAFKTTGEIVVRHPLRVDDVGKSVATMPVTGLMALQPAGVYSIYSSPVDGGRRIVAWRKVEGYPLGVATGLSVDEVVAGWYAMAIPLLAASVPALLAGVVFAWAALRRIRREHGLRRRLEDVVAERTRELSAALATAERAVEARNRFLAAASHDLRQPLQAIRLFLAVFTERAPEDLQPVVQRMEEATKGAERLLHSILDLARIEAGTVPVQPTTFVLGEVLEAFRLEYEIQATHAGACLRVVPCSVAVHADRVIVQRIIGNLLANAVKYGGGRILAGCRRHGRTVRVEVWDEGPGIPADQEDLIFEDFYQICNPERSSANGLGLGLSNARRLAEMSGFRLWLHRPWRGSCFCFSLDEAAVADRPVTPQPTAAERPSLRPAVPQPV